MLFQAVMKYLSRLVEFKILVNGGMVHYHRYMCKVCNGLIYAKDRSSVMHIIYLADHKV
jgi:hypothetical protein